MTDSSVSVNDAETDCKNILNYVAKIPGDVNQMDSRYFKQDNEPSDIFQDLFKHSVQKNKLKSALHVTKPTHFSKYNKTVSANLLDRNENTSWVYSELLARGLKIMINVGEFDMKDGVRQTQEWTK